MAQAFVVRNDLLVEGIDNPVRVVAVYGNGMVLTIDSQGSGYTLLRLADNLIIRDPAKLVAVLAPTWRDDYKPVINAEANRRIELVFPSYKQSNYTAQVQNDITKYGTDTTQWPIGEQNFKIEADRGWKYVSDIRTASNAWASMPPDPTADSIWPPTITPVQ